VLPSRRRLLASALACFSSPLAAKGLARAAPSFQLAAFSADITPPIGTPLMAGGILPAQRIDDPLFAHGFVLTGAGQPIVLAVLDWCEVRNDAHDRWRSVLAEAARTVPQRVLVTCIHQHDAPIADLEAERILRKAKANASICDLDFHERAVQRVAKAVQIALTKPRSISHLGVGQAKVEKVASNRRYFGPDGNMAFGRTSATRDAWARQQPEGTVDPLLKTLSFWDGDRPVLALSCYATHPMSYYGKGGVSADFPGLARKRRQADDPAVMQMYASGCSGNVTAGKYNDGAPGNRVILADRIYQAMTRAWQATQRHPVSDIAFRSVPLRLEPRNGTGFTVADLTNRLHTEVRPFGRCLAALGLSWRKRADAGYRLDVPVLDFGQAQLLLLPAESYVEFQLEAQRLRPDSFVVTMGYGECAPGYIPVERGWAENDGNLNDWCWVAPGVERALNQAIAAALKK
jgi:hypothetical protein